MIKMYNAEVLSKFPVVQHFRFGSLFSWEHDPNAVPPHTSIHTSNQPTKQDTASSSINQTTGRAQPSTKAPWATASSTSIAGTSAPWASKPPVAGGVPLQSSMQPRETSLQLQTRLPPVRAPGGSLGVQSMAPPTSAPWAKDGT